MSGFINQTLPFAVDLEWLSAPGFSTRVVRMANGKEKRTQEWDGSLGRAVLHYNHRKAEIWDDIAAMFEVCQGKTYSFRVRDPRKYVAISGEGIFVSGQATLRRTRGSYSIDKTITKLDTTHTSITGGTVNYDTGVSADGATAWSGLFYLCMRFDVDDLELTGDNKKGDGTFIAGFKDVPLVEVLGE